MNQIVIKGRLTRDPEVKYVQVKGESKAVCRFAVAVDRSFGEETDFFQCQLWGKRGEAVGKFLRKGSEILTWGEMQSRKYEEKTFWELAAAGFEFCGSKKDSEAAKSSESKATEGFEEVAPDSGDDVPF